MRPRWILLPLVAFLLFSGLSFEAQAQSEDLGKQVFTTIAQPPCMICHTLAAVGATGEIGPNLDQMKPTEDVVQRAVERGVGNMPAFGEILNKEQIQAVARFVAKAARK